MTEVIERALRRSAVEPSDPSMFRHRIDRTA
jgi:hypothetical protein